MYLDILCQSLITMVVATSQRSQVTSTLSKNVRILGCLRVFKRLTAAFAASISDEVEFFISKIKIVTSSPFALIEQK